MRNIDADAALTMVVLEQMLVDYWREVDFNGAAGAVDYFTQDVIGDFGAIKFTGHDGVRQFYADRAAKIARDQKDGVRTTRHVYHNLQIVLHDTASATLSFLIVTFGGGGRPPVLDATLPVAISDTRMDCRREADGVWRVHGFYGTPVLLGGEDFARASLMGKPS
ncbi:hypothetical protein HNO88_002064 [Novosphingobium chloroacetimidivorans]|uniref:SnoaL-like domain-containing protein n=1 Tax=Novosphingobium chloroacetimidivorans TaxID=1428314 RepID=A0A7W7KAY9_9SPHN|nr:nuclear transport factor 2 family protein [Novosphingobium chloroacetimidivorans]MBB4858738.1 hypothetical protein [Novosphingobium chloroacetimidivorans]